LELRCKIDLKSQNKKILNESEERKLLQYEEAVEAIDLIIEYKNSIICGHQPFKELEEQSDKMLMERFLKLSETEMRILLHKYFEKILDLRSSSKKLEMQILDIENQHENMAYRVQNLSHTLQLVRSEAERRIVSLQQQQEEKLYLVLRNLAGEDNENVRRGKGSKHSAVTVHVAGASTHVDKNRFIAKITRYKQETVPRQFQVVPASPQVKVTIEKNKIILQKTNKTTKSKDFFFLVNDATYLIFGRVAKDASSVRIAGYSPRTAPCTRASWGGPQADQGGHGALPEGQVGHGDRDPSRQSRPEVVRQREEVLLSSTLHIPVRGRLAPAADAPRGGVRTSLPTVRLHRNEELWGILTNENISCCR
jgi:hypothetical protein